VGGSNYECDTWVKWSTWDTNGAWGKLDHNCWYCLEVKGKVATIIDNGKKEDWFVLSITHWKGSFLVLSHLNMVRGELGCSWGWVSMEVVSM